MASAIYSAIDVQLLRCNSYICTRISWSRRCHSTDASNPGDMSWPLPSSSRAASFRSLILLAAGAWIASGVFGRSQRESRASSEPVAETPARPGTEGERWQRHPRGAPARRSSSPAPPRPTIARSRWRAPPASSSISRSRRGTAVNCRARSIASSPTRAARSAVKQAQALLDQRIAEYDANKTLIDKGQAPRNNLPALEAAVAAAEAALATAQAEADRSRSSARRSTASSTTCRCRSARRSRPAPRSPRSSIPTRCSPSARSASASAALSQARPARDDALHRRRHRRPAPSASSALSADKATRTYPVEARMDNPDAAIGDGVTCEMVVNARPDRGGRRCRARRWSSPTRASSACASSTPKARRSFVPVTIVDDGRESIWVTGIDQPTRVIVVGQDFVKDGDQVEAVLGRRGRRPAEPPA